MVLPHVRVNLTSFFADKNPFDKGVKYFILFLNKILKQLLRKIPHNCVVVLGIRQDSCVLRLVLRNFPLTSVFKSFN